MNHPYRPTRRQLELIRAAWGSWLLIAPEQALRRLGGRREPDPRSIVVTRILGARQVTQAGLSGFAPSPAVLAVGAWVDGVHALTAVALALSDRERARTSGLDACVAGLWSVLGRQDIRSTQSAAAQQPGWRDRLARQILPFLPGAPATH